MALEYIKYIESLIALFAKENAKNQELVEKLSADFRALITDIEIYLYRAEEQDKDVEQAIAKRWSDLSAMSAVYSEKYSDAFLNMSRMWADPRKVPLKNKYQYIESLRNLLGEARQERIVSDSLPKGGGTHLY